MKLKCFYILCTAVIHRKNNQTLKKNTVIQICGHNNPHQVVQTLGEKDMIITLNQIDKIGGSLSGTLCVCDTIILKAA